MSRSKAYYKLVLGVFVLLLLALIISACDRLGRAPDDLDITPTVTAVPATPTPTPGAAPTAAATGDLQPKVDAITAVVVPAEFAAGGVVWQRQGSEFDEPRTEQNGQGISFTIKDQLASEAQITYIVFASPEEAQAHWDSWLQVRASILGNNALLNDTFPSPNIFSRGSLYGSLSMIIVDDVYFLEVFIKVFNSTQGNPLVSLTRQALTVLETGIANIESGDTSEESSDDEGDTTEESADDSADSPNQAQLDTILANFPAQLQTNILWELAQPEPTYQETLNDPNGVMGVLHYAEVLGGTLDVEVSVFDDVERAQTYFDTQASFSTLENGEPNDEFPEPNLFANRGRYGSAGLIRLENVVVRLLVPVTTTTQTDPMPAAMRFTVEAVQTALEDGG